MNIILYISFGIVAIVYIVMIILFTISWYIRKNEKSCSASSIFVSVIIANRNEEAYLPLLIDSLLLQKDAGDFEIIIVDDHSDDNSKSVIESYSDTKIKYIELPENKQGKKEALRYATQFAKGKMFLFTDADCILPVNWISAMVNGLAEKKLDMICGPVEFISRDSLFSYLVELEFLSLTGSGAAGFFLKMPFMCNGANYAIKKSVFDEASKHFNDKFSSGDDVFLLQYVAKKYKVDFLKSRDAIVKTKAPQSIIEFFDQRIRWASKTSGYKTFASILTALVTFLMSLTIVSAFALSIYDVKFLAIAVFIIIAKTIVDLGFLLPVLSFHKKLKFLFLSPLIQLLYPGYIFATGVLSLFSKPKWKGRRIKG